MEDCNLKHILTLIIQKMGQEEFHGTKNHGFYCNNEDFCKCIILLDELTSLIFSSDCFLDIGYNLKDIILYEMK